MDIRIYMNSYPKRSRAANPPSRSGVCHLFTRWLGSWVISYMGTEHINFNGLGIPGTENMDFSRGQIILIFSGVGTENIDFFVVWGERMLIFFGPGADNTDFLWSGDRKYWFLVVWGQKILILSSPGTFQRALGRLQEVLEGFWAETIAFSLVFQGFGGVSGLTR